MKADLTGSWDIEKDLLHGYLSDDKIEAIARLLRCFLPCYRPVPRIEKRAFRNAQKAGYGIQKSR